MTEDNKFKITIDNHTFEFEKNSCTIQYIAELMKSLILLQHGEESQTPLQHASPSASPAPIQPSSLPQHPVCGQKIDFTRVIREPIVPESSQDFDQYLRQVYQHAALDDAMDVCTLLAWLAINWGKHATINGTVIGDYMGRVGYSSPRKDIDQLIRDTKARKKYFEKSQGRKQYKLSSLGITFIENQVWIKPTVKKDDETKDK